MKKQDIPMGEFRRLTVVAPEAPEDLELTLEPNANPAGRAFQEAMFAILADTCGNLIQLYQRS